MDVEIAVTAVARSADRRGPRPSRRVRPGVSPSPSSVVRSSRPGWGRGV